MPDTHRTDGWFSSATAVLRQQWRIVLACSILVPALAFGLSQLRPTRYQASASLLFRDPGFDQTVFGSTFLQPSADPAREAATNLRLVSLELIAERTAEEFEPTLTRREVSEKVVVAGEGLSDVVRVDASDPDPEVAARLANAFAAEYIEFRRSADRAKIDEASRLVRDQLAALSPQDRDGDRGRELAQRGEQLELLASLQTGNAELVEPARPPERPASPKPLRNAMLGLLLGIGLGIALAFARDRTDRRLRDPGEVERLLDRPLLGLIPESAALRERILPGASVEAEAFGILQANTRYFDVDSPIRSVLVTSPGQGEGKSTVAWHLASAAARAGVEVLLVEADLRRPMLAVTRGLRPDLGLTRVLRGGRRLEQAVQHVEGEDRTDPSFDVITAGVVPPNPEDLLDSDRMRALIADGMERYDLVIVDTPPATVVSDAIPLLRQVDGVVVVARLGVTMRDSVARLRAQLANVDAPVLGAVVNSAAARAAGYGYGSGYGHDVETPGGPPPPVRTRV